MSKKNQSEVIQDLQISPDYIILNNPMATPKFVRQVGKKGKEQQVTEIYTPKIFFEIVSRLTPQHLEEVIKKTATDEEKENVAAILRSQSSIYANKTVSDFRHKMYWVTFITMFIKTYSDRFEPAFALFSNPYEEAMQQVLKLDKSKYNKLVY
jgi:hypothetical protein